MRRGEDRKGMEVRTLERTSVMGELDFGSRVQDVDMSFPFIQSCWGVISREYGEDQEKDRDEPAM